MDANPLGVYVWISGKFEFERAIDGNCVAGKKGYTPDGQPTVVIVVEGGQHEAQ